jgi:adenylate cyclase
VKGKANPVVIYTPNANGRRREAKFGTSGESTLIPATIIGRQQETDGITSKIGDLLVGKAGVLVVEGVAGMGKSALMRFATEMAREKGLVHYVSSSEATDKTTSYYAWKTIICQILGIEPEKEQPLAQLVEACSNFVTSKDSLDYLPLLNKVLPITLPENDLTKNISPKLAQSEIRRLMKGFVVNKTKKGPLLILLEDIQWLDVDSLALLYSLAHDTSLPILFLLTGRPNPAGTPSELSKVCYNSSFPSFSCNLSFSSLTSGPTPQIFLLEHCLCLKLEPITKEQSVHLIKQCLACTTVSQTVLDLVYSKALGNPMFVEEIVYRLRDAGILQVEGGECIVSGDMSILDLPGTMQGVIASRIDSLPASPQMVLKVGEYFPAPLLQFLTSSLTFPSLLSSS